MSEEEFYTFRQYMTKDKTITPSMQDYVEMIYRLSQGAGFTRIHDLAAALNIQPPSATKMVQKLSKAGLVDYKKYGVISLNEEGKQMGHFLLERHLTIQAFLQIIGVSQGLLEETEKIEHTISLPTLEALGKLVDFFAARPDILLELKNYMVSIQS